jgi:hypothetical protein
LTEYLLPELKFREGNADDKPVVCHKLGVKLTIKTRAVGDTERTIWILKDLNSLARVKRPAHCKTGAQAWPENQINIPGDTETVSLQYEAAYEDGVVPL